MVIFALVGVGFFLIFDSTPQKTNMIHSRKLTWNLKILLPTRNLLFQRAIFRFHVSFRGVMDKNRRLKMYISPIKNGVFFPLSC